MKDVNGKTTVIILGDARNNYTEIPATKFFEEVYDKAQRVIWLNPEPRSTERWGR